MATGIGIRVSIFRGPVQHGLINRNSVSSSNQFALHHWLNGQGTTLRR